MIAYYNHAEKRGFFIQLSSLSLSALRLLFMRRTVLSAWSRPSPEKSSSSVVKITSKSMSHQRAYSCPFG